MKFPLAFGLLALLLTNCAIGQSHKPLTTLKAAYQKDFLIGVAINQAQFTEADARALPIIPAQFNSISPENVLKWDSIHPHLGSYAFTQPDHYVAFGERNGLAVIGHTLIWHSQTPAWVFQDEQGKPASRELLLARMHDHIATVVGRYRGRIKGWDVVNEALNEDGTLRPSPWLKIIGDDYIEQAFRFAHEADPAAELYYNDYSLENESKRKGAIALLKKLQAQGVAISAIGLQGHCKMDWPTVAQADATIAAFAQLGVKVMITELDIDVVPATQHNRSADITANAQSATGANLYTNGLPAAMQQALAQRYADLFRVYLQHRAAISRVTFWGVTDGDSWLNTPDRVNYPLLFDRAGQPKPAFARVLAVGIGQK